MTNSMVAEEQTEGGGEMMLAPPQHLSLPIADAVIFYSDEDFDEVHNLRRNLMENTPDHSIIIHLHDELGTQGRVLQEAEEICRISVQCWFYITENLFKDETMVLHKDVKIMDSLKKDNAFIPIWSRSKHDFEDLPYGVKAFTGLYPDDKRFSQKVVRMFKQNDHQSRKEHLAEEQCDRRKHWVAKEREMYRLRNEREQEEHKKEMENIRQMYRYASVEPNSPRLETDTEIFAERARRVTRRQASQPVVGGQEEAIPEYLLASLESARSSQKRRSPTVFNITINQPQNVTISGASKNVREGSATTQKNITVDGDNPNLQKGGLNLTEHSTLRTSVAVKETSLPHQESHPPSPIAPSRESGSSGSSYEVVPQ